MSEPASYGPHLPDVYRFAFLMTGHAATAAGVLQRTVERAARGGIGDLRDIRRVKRWLFTEARQQCAQPLAESPPAPAREDLADLTDTPAPEDAGEGSPPWLARQFARLPEAERCALILFYLYLFDPAELAEVLEIPPAKLAPLLAQGRTLLGQPVAALP